MLIEWHQKVGMPQKGKIEIRNELDQVCSIISDEAVKKQMYWRIKDANMEVHDNEDQTAAPAINDQDNQTYQEELDLYYQLPIDPKHLSLRLNLLFHLIQLQKNLLLFLTIYYLFLVFSLIF